MRKSFFLILFLCAQFVFCQYSRSYWFAPPQFTTQHADEPLYIVLTTTNYAGDYKVSLPARNQVLFSGSLGANQTVRLPLVAYLSILKPIPFNRVHANGILIESNVPISAFYEVVGDSPFNPGFSDNTEIFALRGENALGKEFVLMPSSFGLQQNIDAHFSFQVVATEDNTEIEIISKQALFQTGTTPYKITLKKGEVYSQRSLFSSTGQKLRPGLRIKSNKPVAVTQNDDSILMINSWDSAGDQLVPLDKAGNEYFLVKSRLGQPNFDMEVEYVVYNPHTDSLTFDMYLANEVKTKFTIPPDSFVLLRNIAYGYLKAEKSFLVFQIDFYSNEASGALLVPYGCNLSGEVVYTKTTADEHLNTVVIDHDALNELKLNGNNIPFSNTIEFEVNQLGKKWVLATFDLGFIPVNGIIKITHPSNSFLSLLMAGSPTNGQRMAYLSPYSRFVLPDTLKVCKGESIELIAGLSDQGYLWNTGSTENKLLVNTTGIYSVTTSLKSCNSISETFVSFVEPVQDVLPDTTFRFCEGEKVRVNVKNLALLNEFSWQNGSRLPSYEISRSEKIVLTATDFNKCKIKDSLLAFVNPIPSSKINIQPLHKDEYCQSNTLELSADLLSDSLTYSWSTTEVSKNIFVPSKPKSVYRLKVSDPIGCSSESEIFIDCSDYIGFIPNVITPNGDNKNDRFIINNYELGTWDFALFNRYGVKVDEKKNYNNDFDANLLENGHYYFLLKHSSTDRQIKGWLEVIK